MTAPVKIDLGGRIELELSSGLGECYGILNLPEFPLKNYLVYDIENTVDLTTKDPSARVHSNKMVAMGYITDCCKSASPKMWILSTDSDGLIIPPNHPFLGNKEDPKIIIGHNIKHDLKFMLRDWKETPFVLGKMACWDTMVAHYLLSGQQDKFPDLNTAASFFGLNGKDDLIGKYLELGQNVDQIPPLELHEYLRYDVLLTYMVAALQIKEASQRGMFNLILTQCQATMAIAAIEHNGIKVHSSTLEAISDKARTSSEMLETTFKSIVSHYLPNTTPHGYPRNATISKTSLLQALIYGGEYTFEWAHKATPASKRNTIEKETIKFPGGLYTGPVTSSMKTPSGDLAVSEEALDAIISEVESNPTYADALLDPLLHCIRDYRLADKIRRTYIAGITENVFNTWTMYGTINQTATDTGRLSSSNPNLQNFPNETFYNLKSVFTSRFVGGKLVEADFKQIEVVALAYLVGEGKLRDAIRKGLDIHELTGHVVYGRPVTPEEKRTIKGINFGLIYGGSAKTIAAQTGVDIALVRKVISTFYTLYPEVGEWQKANMEAVNKDIGSLGMVVGHSEKGYPIKRLVTNKLSPTGRCFTFTQGDNPYFDPKARLGTWGEITVNVKPTVIKNYPVQGFATADIVPLVLGTVWRKLTMDASLWDNIKLVNTVHDSFLLDVHPSYVPTAIKLLEDCVRNTPVLLEKAYKITDWELPVKCEIKVGPNWGNLTKVEI